MRNENIGREGRVYLKVKIKSLDEEIRIIRKEMRKATKRKNFLNTELRAFHRIIDGMEDEEARELARQGPEVKENQKTYGEVMHLRRSLASHMASSVKSEFRHALIALAFCKGKPYSSVERYSRNLPNWKRVETLARRYGAMCFGKELKGSELDDAWKRWYREALEHVYISGGGFFERREKDAAEGKELRAAEVAEKQDWEFEKSYAGENYLRLVKPTKVLPKASGKSPEVNPKKGISKIFSRIM